MALGKLKPGCSVQMCSAAGLKSSDCTMVPEEADCEGTTIVLLFKEDVASSSEVQVTFQRPSCSAESPTSEDADVTRVKRLNNRSFSFSTPEMYTGAVLVVISIDGHVVANKSLTVKSRTFSIVSDLTQFYVYHMSQMTHYILQEREANKKPLDELDLLLSTTFDYRSPAASDIPIIVFQEMFGMYRNMETANQLNVSTELPTLIHLAAHYGLQELCTRLIDLPGSEHAASIRNKQGKNAETVAKDNGHVQLAAMLNCRRMKEGRKRRPPVRGYVVVVQGPSNDVEQDANNKSKKQPQSGITLVNEPGKARRRSEKSSVEIVNSTPRLISSSGAALTPDIPNNDILRGCASNYDIPRPSVQPNYHNVPLNAHNRTRQIPNATDTTPPPPLLLPALPKKGVGLFNRSISVTPTTSDDIIPKVCPGTIHPPPRTFRRSYTTDTCTTLPICTFPPPPLVPRQNSNTRAVSVSSPPSATGHWKSEYDLARSEGKQIPTTIDLAREFLKPVPLCCHSGSKTLPKR